MANLIDSLVVNCAIKASADKFYNFFKFNMNELVKVFPAAFTSVEILEGEEGKVGCVKRWHYIVGLVPATATEKLEAIDDGAKSLTFSVLEGDLLVLYKSFKAVLEVSDGLAKWTLIYERATILSPPPEAYIPLITTMCTLVDTFLLI